MSCISPYFHFTAKLFSYLSDFGMNKMSNESHTPVTRVRRRHLCLLQEPEYIIAGDYLALPLSFALDCFFDRNLRTLKKEKKKKRRAFSS